MTRIGGDSVHKWTTSLKEQEQQQQQQQQQPKLKQQGKQGNKTSLPSNPLHSKSTPTRAIRRRRFEAVGGVTGCGT